MPRYVLAALCVPFFAHASIPADPMENSNAEQVFSVILQNQSGAICYAPASEELLPPFMKNRVEVIGQSIDRIRACGTSEINKIKSIAKVSVEDGPKDAVLWLPIVGWVAFCVINNNLYDQVGYRSNIGWVEGPLAYSICGPVGLAQSSIVYLKSGTWRYPGTHPPAYHHPHPHSY